MIIHYFVLISYLLSKLEEQSVFQGRVFSFHGFLFCFFVHTESIEAASFVGMYVSIIVTSFHKFIINVHCFPRNELLSLSKNITCNHRYGMHSMQYLDKFSDHVYENTSCHTLIMSMQQRSLFSLKTESNLVTLNLLTKQHILKISILFTYF